MHKAIQLIYLNFIGYLLNVARGLRRKKERERKATFQCNYNTINNFKMKVEKLTDVLVFYHKVSELSENCTFSVIIPRRSSG